MGFYAEPWLREARDRIRSLHHETAGESAEAADFNQLAEAVEKAIKAALIESHANKLQSAEAEEGLASFAEKRAAKWPPKTV